MANYQEILQQAHQKVKDYQQQLKKSPQVQNLLQRWQQLSKREQYLLGGVTIVIVLTIIYRLIILPLNTAIDDYKANVIKDEELLVFMKAAVPRIQAAKGEVQPTKTINPAEFLPTVENTLREKGLLDKNVSELGLVGNDSVHVQFNEVDFSLLLRWLVELRQQYGISVAQFSATPSELPGIVSADLQITRPTQ